jgi:flagellar M-ring protein FliF
MPRQLTSFFSSLGSTIRGFSIAQRTIAIIGIAVVAVGITALAIWASKPSYAPLFSGLQPADASSIVDQLQSDSVPYQLTDGGSTILVPQQNVYQERLKAASAGLPSSDTGGYSLLDKMGVTSSDFQQSVTYKRAMEGELAATIGAMKGVKAASVRLAIPDKTVFDDQQTDPTASVFVQTENGVSLSTDQVQAIVHLTSASVSHMQPTDVAVIDAKGTVLSAVGTGTVGGADEQASDYETRVRDAVQAMLDKVVGVGNASVVVAADVSNESAQRTEESYVTPTDAPSLSETSSKETYSGSGGTAAGVLGPDNIAVPNGGNGTGTYNSESTTKDNAVNKVTEQRTIPAGAVTRQTVSVALDKKAAAGVSAGEIRRLVESAAGIDSDRGDQVTVEFVSFSTQAAAEAGKALKQAQEAEDADRLGTIVRTGIIALAVLAALVIVIVFFRRRARRDGEQTPELEAFDTLGALGIEAATAPTAPTPLDAPTVPLQLDAVGASPDTGPGGAGPADAARRRAEIEALAERDPEKTAEFLRGLLDDRQNA